MTKPCTTKSDAGEDIRSRRKSALIKLAIVLVLAIIVWLFSSIAWFSKNKNASGSGMSITTATMKYDIATKGAKIRNESTMTNINTEYIEGVSDEEDFYSSDRLLLRFTPDPDDPDTDINEYENPPDISPGSSGELNLYVIPKVDEAFSVNVSLNVVPFAEIDKYETVSEIVTEANGEPVTDENEEPVTTMVTQKTGTEIIELTNENAFRTAASNAGNEEAYDEAAQYLAAANYLKGHILFFGESNDTSSYYYASPITERNADSHISFDFDIPANQSGKKIQVPIYWMWTNTFGQIALKNNNSELRSGPPVVEDLTNEQITALPNDPMTDKESRSPRQ